MIDQPILNPGEEIKDIPGYEGLYAITSHGRVWSYSKNNKKGCSSWLRSTHNGKWLKRMKDSKEKEFQVSLFKNQSVKSFWIKTLVAKQFIENKNNYSRVEYIDKNMHNLNVNNLRYVIPLSNSKRKNRRKKVKCLNNGIIFNTVKDATNWCKLSKSALSNYFKRKAKSAGKHPETREKLTWEYVIE